MQECQTWIEVLKKVTETIGTKYADKTYICRYYQEIYEELKKGRSKEQVTDAFDGPGMLLTGVLVRCMEKEGVALGVETGADQILENLLKRYRPHKDKGNFNTRIRRCRRHTKRHWKYLQPKIYNKKRIKSFL